MLSPRMFGKSFAASLALVAAGCAMAEAPWRGDLMPFFWAAGVEGDATVAGRDVDVDVGADDIFYETDAAASMIGVFWKERLVLWSQIDYLDLDTDKITTSADVSGKLKTTATIGTLAVGWRFAGWKPGQNFDVLVGARHLSLENQLRLNHRGSFDGDDEFTDGVLLVHPSIPVAEDWRFNPVLSYGSGDSDNVWELWPQFHYAASAHWAVRVGYRRLHYDLEGERGGNDFDAAFHGLTFGAGYVF